VITVADANGDESGNSLRTVALVSGAACLLVALVSLADIATFGSLFWAIVLVIVVLIGAAAFVLDRIKPSQSIALDATQPNAEQSPAQAEEAGDEGEDEDDEEDDDDDEDDDLEDAEKGSAAEPASTSRQAGEGTGTSMPAAEDEFERIMSKRDSALEVLLADARSKEAAQQPDMGNRLRDRVERLSKELDKHSRQREPLVWAAIMHAIGDARFDLGTYGVGTGQFGEAVRGVQSYRYAASAYRRALKIRTREKAPTDYATTQLRLGETLVALARREPIPEYVTEAIEALREALLIFPAASEDAVKAKSLLDSAQQLYEIRQQDVQSDDTWL
jgi:hypothetical protein